MKKKTWIIAVALSGSTVALATARADVVTLHDGSQIVGKIEQLAAGKLTIRTDFAGKIEIDVAKIKSVGSESRVNVSLKSGDQLVGTVTAAPDRAVVDTAVGAIPVSVDQVTQIWPEGQDSPEVIAKIARYRPKWSATVEGGVRATDGNTDTLTGMARASLQRKTADDLFKLYASADYSENDDVRNRSEYIAGARYENQLSERWFWYTRTEFEYDEFEDLDLRATVAGGVGYYWLKKEHHELKTNVGAGYRHEAYNDGGTSDDAILDLGLDYRLDLATWAQFTHSTVYSPSLEQFKDYRLRLDTALAFPLANSDAWKLKLGVINDYNSRPQGDRDRLDNTYYANIVVNIQ